MEDNNLQIVPFQSGTITGVRDLAHIVIPMNNAMTNGMVIKDNKINSLGQLVEQN